MFNRRCWTLKALDVGMGSACRKSRLTRFSDEAEMEFHCLPQCYGSSELPLPYIDLIQAHPSPISPTQKHNGRRHQRIPQSLQSQSDPTRSPTWRHRPSCPHHERHAKSLRSLHPSCLSLTTPIRKCITGSEHERSRSAPATAPAEARAGRCAEDGAAGGF